jgi:hypothetical protein
MLKSIKKKDSIQLIIMRNAPLDLMIKVYPKENNRITTSTVKIQNIQNLDIDIPQGYTKPIIISSSEYQKMCKDMSTIGNVIRISSRNFHISFDCDAGGILKRQVEFGEIDDSDNDEDDEGEHYLQEFDTEQLCRITRLVGLGQNIQIFPGLPILFRCNVGNLGTISVYIKSNEQIQNDTDMDYD